MTLVMASARRWRAMLMAVVKNLKPRATITTERMQPRQGIDVLQSKVEDTAGSAQRSTCKMSMTMIEYESINRQENSASL